MCYYYYHFTHGETEAQRSSAPCPGFTTGLEKPALESKQFDAKSDFLNHSAVLLLIYLIPFLFPVLMTYSTV